MSKTVSGNLKALAVLGMNFIHYSFSIASFCLCWAFFYHVDRESAFIARYDLLMCGFYSILLLILFQLYQSYGTEFNRISELIYTQSLSCLISTILVYFLHTLAWLRFSNPVPFIILLIIQVAFNCLWSVLSSRLYFSIHKPKKAIAIYRNENDLKRIDAARRFPKRFIIEKSVAIATDDYEEIYTLIEGYEVIFVAGVNATLRNAIAKYCVDNDVIGYFVPHIGDIMMMGARPMHQFAVPIVNVRRVRPMPIYSAIKRIFDILVSVVAIVFLSPLMLLCAIIIKLYDKGPVLYKQTRLTKNGKRFKIFKFRSMKVDAEKDGIARLSSQNDNRITPIGRIIRACRFDELPQLFNILLGQMSIVGPRPERPEIAERYKSVLPAFDLRLQVKAGLTGYAQVYGRYNTEPYDKLEMDLMYINRMSIIEDCRLMLATVKILFLPESTEGVADGQVTAMNHDNVSGLSNGSGQDDDK